MVAASSEVAPPFFGGDLPKQKIIGNSDADQRRFILHWFGWEDTDDTDSRYPTGLRLNNSGPSDKPWASSILLAYRYGCTVLKHFASAETQQGLQEVGYAPLPESVRTKVDTAIDALQ